jgi:hypothetical protein
MIGLCNGQTSQKIGIDRMAGMRLGETWFLIEGFYSHLSHKGPYGGSAQVNRKALDVALKMAASPAPGTANMKTSQ